jgi:hypothetical protein
MNLDVIDCHQQTLRFVRAGLHMAYATRDAALQHEACEDLRVLRNKIVKLKAKVAGENAVDDANKLACMQCLLECVINFLQSWILLKQDRPNEAWESLISAQSAMSLCLRAHADGDAWERTFGLVDWLHAVESVAFPPQLFVSSELIHKGKTCNICHADYDKCEHIRGQCYAGTFCTATIHPTGIRAVAIVEEPANKSCRATQLPDKGIHRDAMTWLPVEEKNLLGVVLQAGQIPRERTKERKRLQKRRRG